MLSKLRIKNIALIEENTINFNDGLNILSGETGAGKSLIIDSLNFVLGARADRSLIKNGEESAFVEVVFFINELTEDIVEVFESVNIEPESTIIISRTITNNGRNEIKLNGENITNTTLKKLTPYLVEIHGQHQHQSLLDSKNHIKILDGFSKGKIELLINELSLELSKLKEINNKISELGGLGKDREKNIELLQYQINEITKSDLKENEEDELQKRKNILLNSEKIYLNLSDVNDILSGNEFNIVNGLKQSINSLKNIVTFDTAFKTEYDKLQNIYYEISDISETLSSLNTTYDYSESELNDIEDRLDLIKSLKRKYGSTISEILNELTNLEIKLDNLINADIKLNEHIINKNNILKNILLICKKLTELRETTSNKIREKILTELKDLGMKNSDFSVQFSNNYNIDNIENEVTSNGADNIEFMFTANLGEPVKPLSKIISGGEMSRFMLAIKTVTTEDSNKMFIFDEIDNGIGGVTGGIVAQKLSNISKNNQVIAVTHLAQIASYADVHIKIEKYEESDKTKTKTIVLNDAGRLQEVSRLLGSYDNSEIGLMHAKELLLVAGRHIN